jgi:hypothetical protein
MILRALLVLSLPLLALAVACTDPPDEPDDPYVVESVPWTVPEQLTYVLQNDDGEEIGRGTLSVLSEGDESVLWQSFGDDEGFTDESVLMVEPESLEPLRSTRTLFDVENDERRVVDTEYGELDDGEYGVRIRQQVFEPSESEEASSTRCNPKSLPESAFDNDSSLFLWRTLPFEEGLEVQYTASIPNRRDSRIVTLSVREPETIETPAGTFEAWHVFVLAEGQSHDAWFEVDAPHRMVRYDNDQQIFLLTDEAVPDIAPVLPEGVPADCE